MPSAQDCVEASKKSPTRGSAQESERIVLIFDTFAIPDIEDIVETDTRSNHRDRAGCHVDVAHHPTRSRIGIAIVVGDCLLYTSDAADE